MMLRVEMHDSNNVFLIKIEGRFAGDDAEAIQNLVARFNTQMRLVIDLRGITFIDSVGEAALCFFKQIGATFIADTAYSLNVCERRELPLFRRKARRRQHNVLAAVAAPKEAFG